MTCYDWPVETRSRTSETTAEATRWEEVDDARYEELRPTQRRSLGRARERLVGERDPASDWVEGRCNAVLVKNSKLGKIGERCRNPAGDYGAYASEKLGPCFVHGGAMLRGRAEAAWLMAHRFALEYDISPWEGLLKAVRIAAGKVAYTEWVLSQATDDLELEGRFGRDDSGILLHPDTGEPLGAGQLRDLSWWVGKNELWVDRLARYSKAAIDAGVAERLVQIEQAHATQVAAVLNGVLGSLESDGVDEGTLLLLRGAMRRELLALDAVESRQSVESDVVDGEAR